MIRFREFAVLSALAVLGLLLFFSKMHYENLVISSNPQDIPRLESAGELVISYSNRLADWALAAMVGSFALLFSKDSASRQIQVIYFGLSLLFLIVSLFFSAIVQDTAVRMMLQGDFPTNSPVLFRALHWQSVLLLLGVLSLVGNLCSVEWKK